MNWLIAPISGILMRLDGLGDNDSFLPFWPFTKIRIRGINYTRYAIGFLIFAFTHQWIYLFTYSVAASIPWGEKHWYMQFGLISWLGIGMIWGAASLSWSMAIWSGGIMIFLKLLDIDQAVLEVLLGMICVLRFCY